MFVLSMGKRPAIRHVFAIRGTDMGLKLDALRGRNSARHDGCERENGSQ